VNKEAADLTSYEPATWHASNSPSPHDPELTTRIPVVLKAAAPDLVHKSDVGAVRLDLSDPAAVRAAYAAVAAALGQPQPAVLVQRMAQPGVELVAGVVHDPLFGSLVMLGLGGVYTDLLADRAFRLLPLTDLDTAAMWRSLRGAPLLTGYRRSSPVDTTALEDLLQRVGRLAEDLPEVAALDLNPVLAGPAGMLAVDVKLCLAPTLGEPDPYLREPGTGAQENRLPSGPPANAARPASPRQADK
jgi:acyl-CoA synthetase (NDP forming)